MMKKLFLFCFLIFSVFPLRAEEYSLTSLINYPAGIFDTLYSGGDAYFTYLEIGARDGNYGLLTLPATPIMQKQTLLANGAINFGMDNLIVDGTLQISNAVVEENPNSTNMQTFSFGNIYVYPSKHMTNLALAEKHSPIFSAANLTGGTGTSGATVYASEVNAFGDVDIDLPESFSAGGVEADKLVLSNISFPMREPTGTGDDYTDGSVIDWKQVKNAASSDSNGYSAWIGLASNDTTTKDTCSGNNDVSAYQCTGSSSCIDVRTLNDDTYYPLIGGAYVSKVLARRECEYTGSGCQMGEYKLDIFTSGAVGNDLAQCGFNPRLYMAGVVYDFLQICTQPSLCGTGGCGSDNPVSCHYILNDDVLSSGAEEKERWSSSSPPPPDGFQGNQPGISACSPTAWPAGSGLECTNAWEEKYALVITCGAKSSGKPLTENGRKQQRTVTCNKADETDGNYYLVLN